MQTIQVAMHQKPFNDMAGNQEEELDKQPSQMVFYDHQSLVAQL